MNKGLNAISKNGEYNAHITNPELVKLIKLCAKEKAMTTINYVVGCLTKCVKEDLANIDKEKLIDLVMKTK